MADRSLQFQILLFQRRPGQRDQHNQGQRRSKSEKHETVSCAATGGSHASRDGSELEDRSRVVNRPDFLLSILDFLVTAVVAEGERPGCQTTSGSRFGRNEGVNLRRQQQPWEGASGREVFMAKTELKTGSSFAVRLPYRNSRVDPTT